MDWRKNYHGYPEVQYHDVKVVKMKNGKVDESGDEVIIPVKNPRQALALSGYPSRVRWQARIYAYQGQGVVLDSADGIDVDHGSAQVKAQGFVSEALKAFEKTPEEITADEGKRVTLQKANPVMSVDDAVAEGLKEENE